jgi:hypothetical protein
MKLVKKAQDLASKENDYPVLKLTPDYCLIRKASLLIASGNYEDALTILDMAQGIVPKNLIRRHCSIQVLQAQCFTATEEYDQAELVTETAMSMRLAVRS